MKRKREDISPGLVKIRKIFENANDKSVNEKAAKAIKVVHKTEKTGKQPIENAKPNHTANKVNDMAREIEKKNEKVAKKLETEQKSRVQAMIDNLNLNSYEACPSKKTVKQLTTRTVNNKTETSENITAPQGVKQSPLLRKASISKKNYEKNCGVAKTESKKIKHEA